MYVLAQNLYMKPLTIFLYIASAVLFILGITSPIMKNEVLFGLKQEYIYLAGSVKYFYNDGEWFLGTLILVFTLILPILKYIIIGLKLINIDFYGRRTMATVMELINKWAMLDVFVVALIIVNFKFDSLIIKTSNSIGTAYFAASVLLLMVCSYILIKQNEEKVL